MKEGKRILATDWYFKICCCSVITGLICMLLRYAITFLVVVSIILNVMFRRKVFVFLLEDLASYAIVFSVLVGYESLFVGIAVVVMLFTTLKTYSMFRKVLSAKIILTKENAEVFVPVKFYDVFEYAVPLVCPECKEFVEGGLYLTRVLARMFDEPCNWYKRVWGVYLFLLKLGGLPRISEEHDKK